MWFRKCISTSFKKRRKTESRTSRERSPEVEKTRFHIEEQLKQQNKKA